MKRFHPARRASAGGRVRQPRRPRRLGVHLEYSPYQNISAERRYPPVLIATSTRDDRVHPGHARKMTAALEQAGKPVWYYENIEGGHAGAADNAQTAFKSALTFTFLHRILAGDSASGAHLSGSSRWRAPDRPATRPAPRR